MNTPDNGGPAFPVHTAPAVRTVDELERAIRGMSLRDYFAAKAMHAHLITDTVPGEACDALLHRAELLGRDPIEHLAFNAYEVADAMLKARTAA
jgi:hypothetical protein